MSTITSESAEISDEDARGLAEVWDRPPGLLGWLSATNHKQIGSRFIATAFVFLALGGLQALAMRTQLARPQNDLVSTEVYNQLFTMHGSTMMFLFAVPVLEGLVMYLLPLMLGTRDMPFPRLNAVGYWAYLFGGLFLYASIFAGEVPDGGWFAYLPLTGPEFSPGKNLDFWLLGVSLVELSGIVGAIEIIVLVLKHRAPGMSINRMPVFAWSALVMAVMMIIAFPVLLTASLLLELERNVGMVFFDPGAGGDPLLWQHLFWIFGHPEVYIMLLPAIGIVSTIVPVAVRRPLVGYPLVVGSLVAIAFASFGLWVHHMFAVGIPLLALSFFTAASAMIAIPSGVQIFAWIATLGRGRVRWTTAMHYIVGFVVVFVLGGITGVMVAMVPFDWQAHDTYFVVAHFHYVLIGGVLFPVFAALHHWLPKIWGRMLDPRLGKLSFWLIFVGFNTSFFPQHQLGLNGMPRRVATYHERDGWETLNLISTAGSYLLGLGVAVILVNALWSRSRGEPAGNDPWGADTLEWSTSSPPPPHNFTLLPIVSDRHPRWNPADPGRQPVGARLAEAMTHHHDQRETIGVTVLDGEPDEVVLIAGPTVWPLAVSLSITLGLVGVLVESNLVLGVGIAATFLSLIAMLWPAPLTHDAGTGSRAREGDLAPPAPSRGRGVRPAGWWGGLTLVTVLSVILAVLIYSYVKLASHADVWPPPGAEPISSVRTLAAVAFLVLSAGTAWWTARAFGRGSERGLLAGVGATVVSGVGALVAVAGALSSTPGVPGDHVYHSMVVLLGWYVLAVVAAAVLMELVVAARVRLGPQDLRLHVALDVTRLLWWFAAGSSVVVLAVLWLGDRL